MSIELHGNETLSQVLDKLLGAGEALYGEEVSIVADGARHQGRLVAKGASFVVLEQDLGRRVMGENGGAIFSRAIIAVHTISSIQFEYVKRGE